MSKRCAKCEKIVYPTEELKCLDKTWHKGCFRCESCGMMLTMKNYKGYDKKPYCNAHYPTTKFTAVADTPENLRIKQNTKIQSNINYHEDFEKTKGKYTSVVDDPETQRLLQNTKNISAVVYHSDFNESLGKYTAVADDPETLRNRKNQDNISSIKYHEDFEKNFKGTKTSVSDDPETMRVTQQSKLISQVEYQGLKKKQEAAERQRASVSDDMQPTQIHRRPSDNDYNAGDHGGVPSPYTAKFTGHSTTYGAGGKVEHSQPRRNVGSISDYDPMQENWGSITKGPAASTTKTQQWEETVPQVPRQQNNPEYNGGESSTAAPPSPRQQANVPMVPVNQPLSLMVHHPQEQEQAQQQQQQQPAYYPPPAQTQQQTSPRHSYNQQQQSPRQSYQQPQQQQPPPQQQPQQQKQPSPRQSYTQQSPRQSYQQPSSPRQAAPPPRKGPLYQAMYDYEAQDDDEISFRDGDIVIDTESIDEGWMYGTVERSGKRGMLPANYVERVQ